MKKSVERGGKGKMIERGLRHKPLVLIPPTDSRESEVATLCIDNESRIHDLREASVSELTVYYISDIHLEHQIANQQQDFRKLSVSELAQQIKSKIHELLRPVYFTDGILLIGGDVADSRRLTRLFYSAIANQMIYGLPKIISILGNHELWDSGKGVLFRKRHIDRLINSYRKIMPDGVTLLENELYCLSQKNEERILSEEEILEIDQRALKEICDASTFLLLGGIGFSGHNPNFNAANGLYRNTLSYKEDIERTRRFNTVYDKVLACAKDKCVVVLTHTPMSDWSIAYYNPKWVYLHGHTHQNMISIKKDEVTVLADNQVGYTPKSWHLNSFILGKTNYNPFASYGDGIFAISKVEYSKFSYNSTTRELKWPGKVYLIKRDGYYMFVLKNSGTLYILDGGGRRKLNNDMQYYFQNLPLYVSRVFAVLSPYNNLLRSVSNEVKKIGGWGKIHGCIVDIDAYNHIYINPFDGKITPYYANDMTDKIVYENIESLLREALRDASQLERYFVYAGKNELPLLQSGTDASAGLAADPQRVLDRTMYRPSRVMKTLQHIFNDNIVRRWEEGLILSQFDVGAVGNVVALLTDNNYRPDE